jgi:hypothetical protein
MDTLKSDPIIEPVSMMRYVVMAALVMIVIILAAFGVIYLTEFDPGNSVGNLTTLISTLIAIGMFGRRENRPMFASERLWFSFGIVLINILVPIVALISLLLINGLPVSFVGADILLGGGQGFLTLGVWIGIVVFVLVFVFLQAYFFCWLLSRKFGLMIK